MQKRTLAALAACGCAATAAACSNSAFVTVPAAQKEAASEQQLRGLSSSAPSSASSTSGPSSSVLTSVGAALGAAALATSARRLQRKDASAGYAKGATVVLRASAQELLAGTGGPFPDNYWDPAGISKNKTEKEILELRAIELKHGRVAMLAVLGWFHNAAGYHFIGDFAVGERVSDNPLVSITQIPMGGVWQVVFSIMCLEWLTTYVCKPPDDKPWDVLGWDDILADQENPDWKKAQLQELNNSRLAMVAFVGLVVGDLMFGEYGASVGKLCGGAQICADLLSDPTNADASFKEVFPTTPYVYPPLYPKA